MIRSTTRVLVSDLREHVGHTVTVCGWVHALRLQRAMQFVLVRDHTGICQVTHRRADGQELATHLDGMTRESAIRVTGRVVENPMVKLGGVEVVPDHIEVLNLAESPLPIDEHTGPEQRLNWRFLDVRRRPAAALVFAVQTTLEQGLREYAYRQGCTELHTPKLMGTASESGAEVFRLDYFGRSAYLAQSPQLFKQMAIASGLDRVFEIGPVFRAEPSFTSRHSTEFTGVDIELAWIDDVDDVMTFEEQMLAHALTKVTQTHRDEIRERFGTELTVPTLPFPRVTMTEAQRLLRNVGSAGGHDLTSEGERAVAAHVQKETGHDFVFITEYPADVRPFYHMRSSDQPDTTRSFDLLWKGLEITTGAQREHRYAVLLEQAADKHVTAGPIQDYLDCFRYGCPPHGGFGMGLGRVLMVMLGLDSLREATFLFRGPHRLTP